MTFAEVSVTAPRPLIVPPKVCVLLKAKRPLSVTFPRMLPPGPRTKVPVLLMNVPPVWTFAAGQVDLHLGDRGRRISQRARTYRALRGDAALRTRALEEIDALLEEARTLESALMGVKGS